MLNSTWQMLNNKTKEDLENQLNCCGLFNTSSSLGQYTQDLDSCPAVRADTHTHTPLLHLHQHVAHRVQSLCACVTHCVFVSPQACKKTSLLTCFTCGDMMLIHAAEALKILGGVGLFFSFTEVSEGHALRPPTV